MISNSDYHPSKDTVMSIAKALSLSVGQLKDMLESAGYSSQDIRQNGLKTNFDKGAWKFAQSIASLRNTEDLLSDTSASPDGKRQRLVQELATTYTKETTIRIIEESLSLSLSDISTARKHTATEHHKETNKMQPQLVKLFGGKTGQATITVKDTNANEYEETVTYTLFTLSGLPFLHWIFYGIILGCKRENVFLAPQVKAMMKDAGANCSVTFFHGSFIVNLFAASMYFTLTYRNEQASIDFLTENLQETCGTTAFDTAFLQELILNALNSRKRMDERAQQPVTPLSTHQTGQ